MKTPSAEDWVSKKSNSVKYLLSIFLKNICLEKMCHQCGKSHWSQKNRKYCCKRLRFFVCRGACSIIIKRSAVHCSEWSRDVIINTVLHFWENREKWFAECCSSLCLAYYMVFDHKSFIIFAMFTVIPKYGWKYKV